MLLNTNLLKWAGLPSAGVCIVLKKKSIMAARKNGAREEVRNVSINPNFGKKKNTSGLLSGK